MITVWMMKRVTLTTKEWAMLRMKTSVLLLTIHQEVVKDSSEDGSVPIAGEPSLQSVSRSCMGYDDFITYGSNSRSLDADMVVDEIFSSDDERAPIAQSIAPMQFFRDDPVTSI